MSFDENVKVGGVKGRDKHLMVYDKIIELEKAVQKLEALLGRITGAKSPETAKTSPPPDTPLATFLEGADKDIELSISRLNSLGSGLENTLF